MALPQRRYPDDEPRNVDIEREPRLRREEAATTGWWGFWWLWILILIAAFWFAGWGWGGYGGWWWGTRAVTVQPVNAQRGGAGNVQPTGSGAAILNATDKAAFVGHNVQISNVQVKNKVNDHVLWIGTNFGPPLLTVLTGPGNTSANAKIGQSDTVTVNGTIEKAPPQTQAKQNWKLDDDGAKRLEQEGVYLQATQVEKSQH